jgi:hypothetical protein
MNWIKLGNTFDGSGFNNPFQSMGGMAGGYDPRTIGGFSNMAGMFSPVTQAIGTMGGLPALMALFGRISGNKDWSNMMTDQSGKKETPAPPPPPGTQSGQGAQGGQNANPTGGAVGAMPALAAPFKVQAPQSLQPTKGPPVPSPNSGIQTGPTTPTPNQGDTPSTPPPNKDTGGMGKRAFSLPPLVLSLRL